jgi:hypothetical protein
LKSAGVLTGSGVNITATSVGDINAASAAKLCADMSATAANGPIAGG